MKHPRKGQNSPSKRSRRHGKALEAPISAATGSNAEPTIEPVTPPTAHANDALLTAPQVETAPATPQPGSATAEARVEPASTQSVTPSMRELSAGNDGVALPEAALLPPTKAPAPLKLRAEQIVKEHLPLAVGAGMLPLPGFDLAAIGGLQFKVLASLAEHYKVPFSRAQAQLIVTSLLGSVGTTLLAGAALVSIAKIVPFFGLAVGAAAMPVAGGVITRALGYLAIDHFEAGGTLETFDLDVAQTAFLEKIAEAKAAMA